MNRKCTLPVVAASAALTMLTAAWAEAPFPSRPITLVVPFAAG